MLESKCTNYVNTNIHYLSLDGDWIRENGCLDISLFYMDKLHLIQKGYFKLALSIKRKISIFQKKFANTKIIEKRQKPFFNTNDFPPLTFKPNINTNKQDYSRSMNASPENYNIHSTPASTEAYLLQSQPNTKEILPTKRKTLISTTFPQKQAKAQSSSTPLSKQLIPTIKQSAPDELSNSDKGNFTTKNKYILSDVQQVNNEIPLERTKRKKCQLEKFQGTQLQESVENQFELRSPSQITTGQEINIFNGNFLHLLSFLQQKFFITFSSIGFQTMSLKHTLRYSIFLISFITSASFLNLNLAFNSIDRSPVDAGLRLGLHETFRRRHGRLLSASYALDLCPVTTGNCHHFYNKTSSTNLSLYGKMAAITNMKIEQNYSKDIFNESISQNLQPIRNNESNNIIG